MQGFGSSGLSTRTKCDTDFFFLTYLIISNRKGTNVGKGQEEGRKCRDSTRMLKPQDSSDRVLNFRHDDRQSCVEGTLDFQVGCGLHVGTAWHLK